MKIATIEHIRCAEVFDWQKVWIPDEMTVDEFRRCLHDAQQKYLAATREHDEPEPPTASLWNYLPAHPELTYAEAKEFCDQATATHRAWQERDRKRRQPFIGFLVDGTGIKRLSDDDGAFETHLNWGHMHGFGAIHLTRNGGA